MVKMRTGWTKKTVWWKYLLNVDLVSQWHLSPMCMKSSVIMSDLRAQALPWFWNSRHFSRSISPMPMPICVLDESEIRLCSTLTIYRVLVRFCGKIIAFIKFIRRAVWYESKSKLCEQCGDLTKYRNRWRLSLILVASH